MTRVPTALAAAMALAVGASVIGPAAAREVRGRRPVVVELYTAQGCTACPQANALLQELAGRRGVVALSFPVDLWDYLGWTDTLAQPQFAARQRAYTARLKVREIYTPEMVVDGRREALGFDREKVQSLIARARDLDGARRPELIVQGRARRVRVGALPARRNDAADVWLVRYDPAERTVKVTSGENKGKTVIEQNVVRELVRLGGWTGRSRSFAIPPGKAEDLSALVILQGVRGGPILATAKA